MRRWWRQRSLRARLTLIATACLAVGLAAGGVLLLRGFAASRVHAIDRSARTVADNIAALTAAGALPETLPVESGQSAQVLDATGAVLAVSPGTLRTLPLLPLDRVKALAGSSADDVTIDAIEGDARSRVLVRSTGGDYVVVATSLRDERDTVAGLSHVLLIVAPLLLAAVAGTLWLLLGRALGAVTALRETAEAVREPAGGTRLPMPGSRDEIHALATTLNAMLDRLAAASERERAFVADAAHELRSPLASMRAQLEVAAAHPTTTTTEQLAGDTLADVERLARLVDDLLILARIDAGAHRADTLVDVAALVDAAADDAPDGPLHVRGDARALQRAVDNLQVNAARHAATTARASARARDGVVEIVVEDDGPGIAAANRERVFERFVRLDDARARDKGGSGLGLAIVRATARAHGGDVTVTDSPLGGAAFVLTLPRADTAAPDP